MNKESILKFFKTIKAGTIKHSPEILTGVGIAGMITTTVLAVKATPKVLMLIDSKKQEIFDELDPSEVPGNNTNYKDLQLKPIEVVKVAWKLYIPAAVTCVASVTCLIGASSVNAKRNAALATAYELSKTALADYKEKVVETVGEKKEEIIREKVAQKKVDENPPTKSEVIITGSGDVLFLEPVSMRYFKSDIENIRKIINDLNYRLTAGMEEYISLSELYDEIGLSHTAQSDDIGWNIYRDGQINIDFPATKTEKGEPCLMLEYTVEPRYDYHRNM